MMDMEHDIEDILKNMTDTDAESLLSEIVSSGATRKQRHALPENLMDGFYSCAYEYYQQGKLAEAEQFFKFLLIYDFYNPDYAFGLAAVYQLKKEYKKALDVYAVSFSLSKKDYRAMFEAGQCNLQLRYVGRAKKCFELVVEHESDPELVKRAKLYLEAINCIRDSNNAKEKKDEWYND